MAVSYEDQFTRTGVETTAGVAVPAKLESNALTIRPVPKRETTENRPAGSNVFARRKTTKEWSEAEAEGDLGYETLGITATSLFGQPVTTAVTENGSPVLDTETGLPLYDHAWNVPSRGKIPTVTQTLEYGDDDIVHRYTGVLGTGGSYTVNREGGEASQTLNLVGGRKERLSGFTVTGADVVAIAAEPVGAAEVSVFIATTDAGLLNESARRDPFNLTYTADSLRTTLWTVNALRESFKEGVKDAPEFTLELSFEANSQGIDETWGLQDAGARRYVRVLAESESGKRIDHRLYAQVRETGDLSEEQSALAIPVTFEPTFEETGGYSQTLSIRNTVATYA